MREQRQEQEQPVDTVRQAVAREEPGVQEQQREQEQPANTRHRAATSEEPGVQEPRTTARTRATSGHRETSSSKSKRGAVTAHRRTCLTYYLSTPVRSPLKRGRNCNDTPPASTHRFSGCGSHRRSSRHRPFRGTSHIAVPYTYLIFEDPSLEFYGLTAIQYQRGIILWLQR